MIIFKNLTRLIRDQTLYQLPIVNDKQAKDLKRSEEKFNLLHKC